MKNSQTQTAFAGPALDDAVLNALERKPEVMVPAGFAARVAAQAALLPAQKAPTRARYARFTTMAAIAILSVVLFAMAGRVPATTMSISYLVEILVLLQLGGLSYWLSRAEREQ